MALGLLCLAGTIIMGLLGGLKFVFPEFTDLFPFFKSRPLHVSLALAWIFSAAIGGIYYYVPKYLKIEWYSALLVKIHFWIFLLDGVLILMSYVLGKFGGREYWAYPPVLSIPIVISWGLFVFNFFKTASKLKEPWPVYLWMWGTGVVFFMITFLEAHLYLIPYFAENITREISVQWKSYGALTGSWNMMVYGTAIFLMEFISGDKSMARSRISFSLFFLGLTNLMFGWAHHTYFVPMSPWIRYLAYAVSMTEWVILARIIWYWKKNLDDGKKFKSLLSYKFLLAADHWILFNLFLALLISIPVINLYTHGTHITVAHAMGSTIGINTMLLLASAAFLIQNASGKLSASAIRSVKNGLLWANFFLFTFLICLTLAGITKGWYTIESDLSFTSIMDKIEIYLMGFVISGIGLAVALLMIIIPLLKQLMSPSEPEQEIIAHEMDKEVKMHDQ